MALTYRLYKSSIIGAGTRQNPFRSVLCDYIIADGTGAKISNYIFPQKPLCWDLARCESAIHALINADGRVIAVSPEMVDKAALDTWLDGDGFSDATLNAALEADGVSTIWRSIGTKRRDLLNHLGRFYEIIADVNRFRDSELLVFFKLSIDTRVNQLSVPVRTRVANWMSARGLDTGWIGGQTTVRQVLDYVLQNANLPKTKLGVMEF